MADLTIIFVINFLQAEKQASKSNVNKSMESVLWFQIFIPDMLKRHEFWPSWMKIDE